MIMGLKMGFGTEGRPPSDARGRDPHRQEGCQHSLGDLHL